MDGTCSVHSRQIRDLYNCRCDNSCQLSRDMICSVHGEHRCTGETCLHDDMDGNATCCISGIQSDYGIFRCNYAEEVQLAATENHIQCINRNIEAKTLNQFRDCADELVRAVLRYDTLCECQRLDKFEYKPTFITEPCSKILQRCRTQSVTVAKAICSFAEAQDIFSYGGVRANSHVTVAICIEELTRSHPATETRAIMWVLIQLVQRIKHFSAPRGGSIRILSPQLNKIRHIFDKHHNST